MEHKPLPALSGALRAGTAKALALKLSEAGRLAEVQYCITEFFVGTAVAKGGLTPPTGILTPELKARAKEEIEGFVPHFISAHSWVVRLVSRHELIDFALEFWCDTFETRKYFPLLTPSEAEMSDFISMAAQLGREELQRLGLWGPVISFSEEHAEGVLSSIAKSMLRAFLDPNGAFRDLTSKHVVVPVDRGGLPPLNDGNE